MRLVKTVSLREDHTKRGDLRLERGQEVERNLGTRRSRKVNLRVRTKCPTIYSTTITYQEKIYQTYFIILKVMKANQEKTYHTYLIIQNIMKTKYVWKFNEAKTLIN